MESVLSFQVSNAAVLSSWLGFPFLFLFGQSIFKQSITIPMGTDSAILLANIYHFSNELDFLDHLLESIHVQFLFISHPLKEGL